MINRVESIDVHVLALVKGQERYIFLYDQDSRSELLRTLGRYAADPALSLNWFDVAALCQRIRAEVRR